MIRKAFDWAFTFYRQHLDDIDPDNLDKILAEYSDFLVQLRSDGTMPMRVVAFKNEQMLDEFATFVRHRDAILAAMPAEVRSELENAKPALPDQERRAESDEEATTEEPRHQTPGESGTQEAFDFGTAVDDE